MYSGSSIVDLKAELSRKAELLKSSKQPNVNTNDHNRGKSTFDKIHAITGKKKKKKQKTKEAVADDTSNDTVLDAETAEQLAKARQKLEAKSKIYDKMKSGEMEDLENIYGETKFLVDFQKKAFEDNNDSDHDVENESSKPARPTSIYEADEEFREKQREKWEAEQKELLDGPVHYENIKFDEIRDLGTGYYAFSKNEEERKKQMEELQKLRNETINIQKKKELLQQRRKNKLQERLNKIKQRKLGLDISEENIVEDNSKQLISDASSSVVTSKNEEENNKVDLLLKQCRDETKPKREWDIGKDSRNFMKQGFIPQKKQKTSQDEFVKERRSERPSEFAPPNLY